MPRRPQCSLSDRHVLEGLYRGVSAVEQIAFKRRIGIPPLGSFKRNISHRMARGSKGITKQAARQVRSGITLLEMKYGKRRLTFLTVTVPQCTLDQGAQVMKEWSEIVRQFVQTLKRKLNKAGLPETLVGVTELQMKRAEKHGFPAPHLHLVFVGRQSYKTWEIKTKEFDKLWERILGKYLPIGTSFRSTCNVKSVKGTLAAYLGKYLSKGAKDAAILREKYPSMPPLTSWHTCSINLKRAVARATLSGLDVGSRIMGMIDAAKDYLTLIYPVKFTSEGGKEITVGYGGVLSAFGKNILYKLSGRSLRQRIKEADF